MNDGVYENIVQSQNSLLYQLLTEDINSEDSTGPNDLENPNDEEGIDLYQLKRRYTLETSEVNRVQKQLRYTPTDEHNIISEDLLELTRESFDKLSTETSTNLSSSISRNIYSSKRRLGVLFPSPSLPLPYSTKRKRTNQVLSNANVSTQLTHCLDGDYLKLSQLYLENRAVVRKRSYTLPHSSLSNLNQCQNGIFRPTSKAMLSPRCANLVLKFVVAQLKKISSFILENRDLFKIPLDDLTKIIVRLLLLQIADTNLHFSVTICQSDGDDKRVVKMAETGFESFAHAARKIPKPIKTSLGYQATDSKDPNITPFDVVNEDAKSIDKNKELYIDISAQPFEMIYGFSELNPFDKCTDLPSDLSIKSANDNTFNTSIIKKSFIHPSSQDISSQAPRPGPIDTNYDSVTNAVKKHKTKPVDNSLSNPLVKPMNINTDFPNIVSAANSDKDMDLCYDFKAAKEGQSADSTVWPTLNFTEMVRRLIVRYQGLCVTRNEHDQLKLAILHMNGELSSVTQKKLQELVALEFPNDPLRYSKLLLSLYSLCSIDIAMAIKFFCPSSLDVTTFVLQEIKG